MALRWSVYAALALGFWAGSTALAAPQTCADVRARIERQLAVRAAPLPTLLIVPKGLAAGSRVLGSCENGTQKIVYRAAVPVPPPDPTSASRQAASRP